MLQCRERCGQTNQCHSFPAISSLCVCVSGSLRNINNIMSALSDLISH